MDFRIIVLLFVLSRNIRMITCQQNALPKVAPVLIQCYNTTNYLNPSNRFPATMSVLIEMIRQIEDSNKNLNARELSTSILQRYKQDGIQRSPKDVHMGLPYSPIRGESFKNNLLLKYLIPKIQMIDDSNIDGLHKCSLHFMISNTVEPWERGDENTVCRYLGRYRVRTVRASEFVETLQDYIKHSVSECPLEEGVVYSKWGTVKAGDVLAGIAAGYNNQEQIVISKFSNVTVDNKYASTIAGELAEASLYQESDERRIGCDGHWNSTLLPQYYFLSRNEDLEVTDAEIRGGLDGLYLAKYIAGLPERESLKISQILDLYYSPRGLGNSEIKACNRSFLQTQYAPSSELQEQTEHFCSILDNFAKYSVTYERSEYDYLTKLTIQSFNNYITHLNDLPCSVEDRIIQRTATDIIIFIDATWNYKILLSSVSHILDNIDINKYESSYRIISGQGDFLVNGSSSILDSYRRLNMTTYNKLSKGMDYSKIFEITERLSKARLHNETIVGGKSTIVLIVTHTAPNNNEKQFMIQRKEVFKRYIPDLKIIILGSGSKSDYGTAVPQSDIFILGDSTNEDNIKTDTTNVIERIKTIGRNVVNPKCGSHFATEIPSNTFELTQYVEPQGINYYRIAPNYFYSGSSDRKLHINNAGDGDLTVCTSRSEQLPKRNSPNTYCTAVTKTSNTLSYDIANNCSSWSTCDPIYFSVEGSKLMSTSFGCKDEMCRFPDNIKFTIKMENVQCYNSSGRLFSSFLLLVISFSLLSSY